MCQLRKISSFHLINICTSHPTKWNTDPLLNLKLSHGRSRQMKSESPKPFPLSNWSHTKIMEQQNLKKVCHALLYQPFPCNLDETSALFLCSWGTKGHQRQEWWWPCQPWHALCLHYTSNAVLLTWILHCWHYHCLLPRFPFSSVSLPLTSVFFNSSANSLSRFPLLVVLLRF